MKQKHKLMILLMVGCLLVLAGCGKKTYTTVDFVGTWDSDYELGSETIEFHSDGTFEKVANSFLGSLYLTGSYSVENDKVIVSFDQTGEIDTFTFEFVDANKMIWTLDSMEDVDYTYIKR